MDAQTTRSGAAVLLALLPVLPLMLFLRRRAMRPGRRVLLASGTASLGLLGIGVALALSHGLPH